MQSALAGATSSRPGAIGPPQLSQHTRLGRLGEFGDARLEFLQPFPQEPPHIAVLVRRHRPQVRGGLEA